VFEVNQHGEFDEPPDEVFDFIVDNRNERGWHPLLKSVEAKPDGPIGVGTVFESEYKRLGTTRSEIVEYERPHRARFDVTSNSADIDITFRFEPTPPGGTALDFTALVEPKGFMKLMGPLAKVMVEREMAKRPQQFREALARRR
jgi:uncharacterized protein YndB with AHSA1/START domain